MYKIYLIARLYRSALLYGPYLLPHYTLLLLISKITEGNLGASKNIFWLWLIAASVDFMIGGKEKNLNYLVPLINSKSDCAWDFLLISFALIQILTLICFLEVASRNQVQTASFMYLSSSVAILSAAFSISAAHELLHDRRMFYRASAFLLLTISSCPHFFIEHGAGHHKNVGTATDPATARLNEGFYTFYQRYVIGSVLDSWSLGRNEYSWSLPATIRNNLTICVLTLIIFYLIVYNLYGLSGVVYFALQGASANCFLALTNYIQHYGLTRSRDANQVYERIGRQHSWDCYHLLSNWFLFNLPRHSEHHAPPESSREDIKLVSAPPTLPAGYLLVIWLPMFPAIWRRVIHARLRVFWGSFGSELDSEEAGALPLPVGGEACHLGRPVNDS